jgi:hypothetical protein
MAHFAKLNENNIVDQVVVINNEVLIGLDGVESEDKGIEFLNQTFGQSKWVQTSYNNNFRKQYASIGYSYDSDNDVFISIKPYPSWLLNDSFDWVAPISMPDDGNIYNWNEENQNWKIINN